MDAAAIEVNHFEGGGLAPPDHAKLRSRRVGHELPLGIGRVVNATEDRHHNARFDFASVGIFGFDADFAIACFWADQRGGIAIYNQLAAFRIPL